MHGYVSNSSNRYAMAPFQKGMSTGFETCCKPVLFCLDLKNEVTIIYLFLAVFLWVSQPVTKNNNFAFNVEEQKV